MLASEESNARPARIQVSNPRVVILTQAANMCAHTPSQLSPAWPACTAALMPARVLSGARPSSIIIRCQRRVFEKIHALRGRAGPRLHGRGKQWWSGAEAAVGRPPIDKLLTAGAAQLAPVALLTNDVLGFV